jgi:mono/diheme cytochrome c family protein
MNAMHRLCDWRLLVAATLLAACAGGWAQDDITRIARGEALLSKNCARCHAIGTSGLSPRREAPPLRTLSRKYPIAGLAEALAEGLSVGHPDMPEFAFEADDVGAILVYLNSIQER